HLSMRAAARCRRSSFPTPSHSASKLREYSSSSRSVRSRLHRFLDEIAKHLRLRRFSAFYALDNSFVTPEYGGSVILNEFNNSLVSAIVFAFGAYRWLEWRFESTSRAFWADAARSGEFFEWLFSQRGIRTIRDA